MRLTILAVMLSLMPALLTAEVTMADGRKPLSVGPNGVEAIAVSENAIDIYLPINHNGVSVTKDGIAIGNALPGVRKLRDEGLAPDTIYTYTIKSIEEPEILLAVVAEKTFTAFQPQATYGVVVVGATAAGTSAAVTAARMGVSVALVEETNRAGGMAANGLGSTDIRNISRSNGFFEEFRTRVASYYGGSHNG
ncbi:MAG TPA: FAD-dependent oxidoreductase, partial [Armatimonadota bacterium]|nr:FAD-dependent oxidoreductase [Armatimonadota bacterium]